MASFAAIKNDTARPTAVHAEMTILGAMLVEPLAIYDAIDLLVSTDFALHSHREIYSAILELHEENTAVDIVTVSNCLRSKKQLDSIGGTSYLASLSEGLPRKFNIGSYVRIVRDKSIARQGMDACSFGYNEFTDNSQEALEIVARLEERLIELSAGKTNNAERLDTIMPRIIEKITEGRKIEKLDAALWYTYGIVGIDKKTKGAYPGELSIILAETSGGKTAWMTQMMVDNAIKDIPCHMFSMEMPKDSIGERILGCLASQASFSQIRDPRTMWTEAYQDVLSTGAVYDSLPITIDDTRQLPIDQLRARAKAAVKRDGVKLIFVDYLQLIRSATGQRQSDTERIDSTMLGLRDLAAELYKEEVHVVALSQYSRPQDGSRGRPTNHRAKGGSTIEQAAQNIFHIVREDQEDGTPADRGEIIIGKQRGGTRGSVQVEFDPRTLRLRSISEDERGT